MTRHRTDRDDLDIPAAALRGAPYFQPLTETATTSETIMAVPPVVSEATASDGTPQPNVPTAPTELAV